MDELEQDEQSHRTANFRRLRRETLLVLDATTGKNAVSQVTGVRSDVADITGIILTKLDGTAKGRHRYHNRGGIRHA